ncbi:MAG TPA: hypothetical protein VF611_20265, partial [Pyrinomonadaceae bacterium]
MKKQGFENAAALSGGWDAWVKAGLPVEGTSLMSQPEDRQVSEGGTTGGQRGGRVRAPEGLKCALDDLTLYDGVVSKYVRKPGSTG